MNDNRYRFGPYTIDLGHGQSISILENKCMCGSCDTVEVHLIEEDGESTSYGNETEKERQTDPYTQIRDLKGIILDLSKIIKNLRETTTDH